MKKVTAQKLQLKKITISRLNGSNGANIGVASHTEHSQLANCTLACPTLCTVPTSPITSSHV
ncbi:hypothetical protein [Chitinophaga niastensis]|uniref:hypothetical protein n=1 Tax=Chitinophaga niastensis TaxID=536980 RepID=UPI001304CB7D|nr:hypothetical protein [Chitinophaga niastensis]